MLIDGLHHAREMSSMSMCVYSTMNLLFDYARRDPQTINLLKNVAVFVVPAINYDGYHEISRQFKENGQVSYLSKNRHPYGEQQQTCGSSDLIGVDLQRNYGYQFAHDEIGSSGNICDNQYRGPSAFSEPETQAIQTLIDSFPNIKLALNFHAYGNNLNIPYNYGDNFDINNFKQQHPVIYEYLKTIQEKAPAGSTIGSKFENSGRSINGEVSDWMFGEKGIYALSPELGTSDINTYTYFIRSPQTLKTMLAENQKWVYFAANTLLPQLNITLTSWTQKANSWHATFGIVNQGIAHIAPQTLNFYYNSEMFDLAVTLDGKAYKVECESQRSCKTELDQVPSLAAHSLQVDIAQKAGVQALREEDFRIVYQ